MSRLLLSQVQRLCQIETKTNKYISNIIIIIVAYGIDYHYSLTGSCKRLAFKLCEKERFLSSQKLVYIYMLQFSLVSG